jgi:hypothetical protein
VYDVFLLRFEDEMQPFFLQFIHKKSQRRRSTSSSLARPVEQQCRRYEGIVSCLVPYTGGAGIVAALFRIPHDLSFPPPNVDLNPSNEGSDLIQVQKDRATARWKEAFKKQYFDDQEMYDQVLKQLNHGKIPPIYHTLCRDPAQRLFLPNSVVSNGNEDSEKIEISFEKVQVGQGTSQSLTDRSIWKKRDFSYGDAFFDNDGKALINVWDYVIEKNWEFDEEVTICVTDLVNTPAVMVGHDLEVTALPNEFPLDFFHGRNLITRSLSRGVVGDCFKESMSGSVHSIVGAPGIGKSWNLIYALQQALLCENVCVMFFFQKKGRAWVCIRKKNQIYAWSITSDVLETKCKSGLFNNGNVLALLDPKEALYGGASFILERQRLIFAASNNAAHFKNFYKDASTLDYERILNPYSTLELKTALKYMSRSSVPYSDDEVLPMLAYAEQVGNKPRYVQSEMGVKIILDKVKKFIQEDVGKMDSLALLDFLRFDGTVGVEVKDSVKGAIYSLFAAGSFDKHNGLVDVGYDGDAAVDGKAVVQYDKRKVMFASNYTKRQIAIAQRAALLSYDGKTADGLGSHFWHIIEELFWMDMEKNIKMQVYEMKPDEIKTNQEKVPYMVDFLFEDAAYYGRRIRLSELATTLLSEIGYKNKFRMTTNVKV